MRASVLFAIVCVLGCAIVSSTAQKVNCVEPPANPNRITLRFMRHGWSCAQCCRDIVLKGAVKNPAFPDCLKSLVKKKDPVLTTIGLKLLTEHAKELGTCLPNDEWTLMASTMTRTIETALALFPKSKVNVVPYMKECLAIPLIPRCSPPFNPDIAPEDTLANSVDEQQKKLGAVGREVNYYTSDSKYSVVKPGPNKTVLWTEAAMTTDPEAFFKFLSDYAKKHNKRKFLLVTHNGVMVKLLLKFGPKLTLLDNAEMWEGTLNLDGSVVKGSVKQVYKPVNTGGSCKAMTPAAFIKATDRCSF